jgi:predicted nuclease with TOPRIM domain
MSLEALAAVIAIVLSITAIALNGLKLWQGVRAERRAVKRSDFDLLRDELAEQRTLIQEQRQALCRLEGELAAAEERITELETENLELRAKLAKVQDENAVLKARLDKRRVAQQTGG